MLGVPEPGYWGGLMATYSKHILGHLSPAARLCAVQELMVADEDRPAMPKELALEILSVGLSGNVSVEIAKRLLDDPASAREP